MIREGRGMIREGWGMIREGRGMIREGWGMIREAGGGGGNDQRGAGYDLIYGSSNAHNRGKVRGITGPLCAKVSLGHCVLRYHWATVC